jgi:diphthine synthase
MVILDRGIFIFPPAYFPSMEGRLFLIGMGICDEDDMPQRAFAHLKECNSVFAENYTNLMREGSIGRLEKKIGKTITILPRELVEGEREILEAAKKGDTALLVPGDPMTATTHSSLIAAAKKEGIETVIVHASSIFTAAAGECGLQIYKFGKTPTITYWRENFRPTSFLDVIAENLKNGAHTLCLLDIDAKLGQMKPSVALKTMLAAQDLSGMKLLSDETKIIILWHVGWLDQRIWAGTIGKWDGKGDSDGPAVIIIPGKMHFVEEESFEGFGKGKK